MSDHHAHHSSETASSDNERRVIGAFLLTAGFMVVEVVGAVISGSLALLADAGHMLTDAGALGLAWYAFHVARRAITTKHSYGQHRFQVLAALVNGVALIGIVVWIIVAAVERLNQPVAVLGGPMLVIAVAGLVVNIAAFAILRGGDRRNLNVRGATLHVLGDLLGSLAAIAAAVVILLTGWMAIDPILSIFVALLILRGAWVLVGESWHVLMEGAPELIDTAELRAGLLRAVPGLVDIHHIHVWSLTPERPLITLHARIAETAHHDEVLHRLQHELAGHYRIEHSTIQIERSYCADEAGEQTLCDALVPRPVRFHG